MPRPRSEPSNDVTVYLVLNDYRTGVAYVETAADEADRETIIRNFISGQYSNPLKVVAFNAAEGWSWDVSEDIALEVLHRAIDADDNLVASTKRFINRYVDDPANPPARTQTSPIELVERLKPDFEKKPPAPSIRHVPASKRERS